MLIPVFNPETSDLEKSYLSNPYSVGVTSISVKNNNRFAANDRIMIGEMGQEKTEIVTISSVNANGNDIVIGATLFSHSADDPVYQLRFDQVKFYRSTDGTTYSVISTQNMDVDNADLTTKYDDTTGTAAYYYKFTFYHSISAVESAYSDVIGGSGWRREQVGNIIDEILQEVSDKNEIHVTRQELMGYFNDVNDDLLIGVSKPYSFLHTRTTLTRTLGRSYIDFPTDTYGKQTMWKFDRMDYNFTDSTTSPLTDRTTTIPVIPMEEFRNTYSDNTISSTTESDDTPLAMTLDTSVNRFRFSAPFLTTASNIFYLHYWKYFNVIDSEGDIIETPTPKIYKLYCKAMFYGKRAIADLTLSSNSQDYMQQYQAEKSRYKQVDRKDKGTPRSFRPASDTVSFRR
jgi:hypothetical protein